MRTYMRVWMLGLGLLLPLVSSACSGSEPEATAPIEDPAGEPGEAGPGGAIEPVDPASVSEADYEAMVAAFYSGVTAMEVGDAERGLEQLAAATGIVPGEPAAWANLALARMRANDLAGAAEPMARALELAPESSAVRLLAGFLAQREGDLARGEALIREAIERDPESWRARYALYDALEQSPQLDEAGRAEMRAQLEAIAAGLPDNPVPWIELAQLAVDSEDPALLEEALAALEPMAEAWGEEPRAQLAAARALAAEGAAEPRERKVAVVTLRNLLLPTEAFQDGIGRLQSAFGDVAPPLEGFLLLATPSAEPSAPDEALRFVLEPVALDGPADEAWAKAAHLQADGPPSLILRFPDRLELRAEGGAGAVTELTPVPRILAPNGALPVDWDNDQRVDLVLAGGDGLMFKRQLEDGSFEDVTAASGLDPSVLSANYYFGAWAVDLDLEGDLDLILGAYQAPPTLLQNDGDGTWSIREDAAFAPVSGPADLVWADLDLDGDPDIAMAAGASGTWLARNDRALGYTLLELSEGPEAQVEGGTPLGLADVDRDGRLDLTTSEGEVFTDLGGDGRLPERARLAQIGGEIGFHRWADLDNNGAPDYVGNGYVGLGGGEQLVALAEVPAGQVHSALDLDGDGWIDLVGEGSDGQPAIWRNQGGARGYGWQVVRPRAVTQGDQRNNSFGIGGEIELRAGLLYQKLPMDGPVIHLGLGDRPASTVVRIRWPNGSAQGEFDLAREAELVADQRLKGSCPWLFAWDGEGMDFVTDVLWRSPLGLRINAQDTAGVVQTRDWVLVRGDELAPRPATDEGDAVYDLRVTAELWETHFFDEVGLLAADHPEGTLAWVDERFSFPPPPLSVQLTGPTAPVAAARSAEGEDIAELIAEADGRHFEGVGRGAYQGIAGDHWTEIELDPAQLLEAPGGPIALAEAMAEGSLRLIAQGWVYPTDSSINVAISQAETTPPVDLSLEVQDAAGEWVELRAGLGFPAGKRKSLLIDLGEAFEPGQPGPWRLRLRTTMEIYWDALQVARLLPETAEPVALELTRSELRYRGFSVTSRLDGSARVTEPEIPDYDRLTGGGQIWLDLEGFYTRFGEVGELLAETDDRYAILNAGDELALEFALPEPPAEGMRRDFVFLSDGWVKDGDYNTSYSRTVRPLPAHDKPEYTLPGVGGALGPLGEDPIYQRFPEDWVDYHTRYVTPRRFQEALVPTR